jgi:hypothetical protein
MVQSFVWKRLGRTFSVATLTVVWIAIVVACSGRAKYASDSPTDNQHSDAGAGQNSAAIPADQGQFVNLVDSYIQQYKSAPNDLKKRALRDEFIKAVEDTQNSKTDVDGHAQPAYGLVGWVGTLQNVKALGTAASADIRIYGSKNLITFTAGGGTPYELFNTFTVIKGGTPAYNALSNLREKSRIRFDGTLLVGKNASLLLSDKPLMESQAIMSPQFYIALKSVQQQ